MKNCMDITRIFSSKKDESDSQREKEKYDLTDKSFDRYGNYNGEKAVDYSDDIVVRKLRRMLP
jgi:hypothetical protein